MKKKLSGWCPPLQNLHYMHYAILVLGFLAMYKSKETEKEKLSQLWNCVSQQLQGMWKQILPAQQPAAGTLLFRGFLVL